MGSSRCSGELQMKIGGEWRAVDARIFLTTQTLASVCNNLKCGSYVSLTTKQLPREKPVFWIISLCFDEFPLNLEECVYEDTVSSNTMEITCSDSVRLENGSSRCSGRLEVKSNNSWSSVCEDDFDLLDAEVVCRELGCGAPSVLQGALYGEAEAPILSREFLCEGHESVLLDCGSSWRKTKACPPDKAVGLTCSDPATVRLMGSSRCSGELQVKIGGEWRAVDAGEFIRSQTIITSVCKNLKCGPHVSSTTKQLPREKTVFQIGSTCFDEFPLNMEKCVYYDTMSSNTLEITCLDSVRLENGSSRCSGRLEVKSNNWWSSVCEDDFDLLDAEVVCRELGCGAPSVLQGALYGEAEAPILTREFLCEGHESVLLDCGSSWRKTKACPPDKAVGLTCSDSVRLENGSSRCSGRLEVKSNNSWSSVCEDDFDLLDAEVVCRELGCGAPSVLQGALYGEAEAPILSREFLCEGHESVLLDCGSSWRKTKACPPDKAVGLTCSDSVRLENGSSRCSGRLEVKSNNSWSSVCEDDFDLLDAEVVCRELGCGAPSVLQGALYGEAEAPIFSREFLCEGHESVLLDCGSSWRKTKACPPDKAVGLTCSDSVRLENGSSRCSGRLEVKSNNWWSSVCEDDFDLLDAEVVCRELGCGAPSVLQGALYGEAEAPILSREFLCEGHESVLLDCGSSWRKTKACPPDKAVGLTCSDPAIVRLMGSSRCSGELQVKIGREWRAVYARDFLRTETIITSVCKTLKCGSHVSLTTKQLPREKTVFQISSTCFDKFPLSMEECLYFDTMSSDTMEITCSDSVRLENGSSRCSGRLEVKSNNWWSSVCEDDFDLLDAEVVCRELGCGAPSVLQGALYGEAEAPILSREFLCKGHESSLLDCNHPRLERSSSSDKVVDLTCSGIIRLEGDVSHCAGTLEMFYGGEWGPVAASTWSRDSASAVCAQLGCGSALSTRSKDNFLNRSVWWIQPPCGPSLEDCNIMRWDDQSQSTLEIICSVSVVGLMIRWVVVSVGLMAMILVTCFYATVLNTQPARQIQDLKYFIVMVNCCLLENQTENTRGTETFLMVLVLEAVQRRGLQCEGKNEQSRLQL
ncbi:antigen WC1.1-like [Oryzias latipes]|uniref:antigen WC1.1-like n=1 Tax=Oryzias latipes TaxID=8090 RepID=UPI000CE220B8|nr:antigen WC1.1-like [Oryzias latipes]